MARLLGLATESSCIIAKAMSPRQADGEGLALRSLPQNRRVRAARGVRCGPLIEEMRDDMTGCGAIRRREALEVGVAVLQR